MIVLQPRRFKAVAAIAGASALLFALYQIWKRFNTHPPLPPPESDPEPLQSEQDESDEEEHIPFDELIDDSNRDRMGVGRIEKLEWLRQINYRAIFCLMKGSSYQGIVCLSFQLGQLPSEGEHPFALNFNGAGIKFLMVNGTSVHPRDISFQQHRISIPRELLREGRKNNLQVIFQSGYCFLNEGLCAYFTVDDNQKYSLRQQVIYSNNGYLQVERMMPCINCLNPCTVRLEVIHPDTFEVFSNSSKALERFCSVTEYHRYPFLFDHNSLSLNRSYRLNSSSVSDTSSQYSSSNFYNRKKANTHFNPLKLPSLHSLFLFSSAMEELHPHPLPQQHPLEDSLLLRYFCKHSQLQRLAPAVDKLHATILDAIQRLSEGGSNPIVKLDVLIVAEGECEGHFAPGAILMSENSLAGPVGLRWLYLAVRAVAGAWQTALGQRVVTLEEILALNELVYSKFQEFRPYLALKNIKHDRVRSLLLSRDKKEYIQAHQGFFLKYYSKELKFVLLRNTSNSGSGILGRLLQLLRRGAWGQFWEGLLAGQNELPEMLVEPLLKMGVNRAGMPRQQAIREQLKVAFSGSPHVLAFYSNQELSQSLPKFLEQGTPGLEERLPQLKVKQKFKDFITQKYEKFLPIKSNLAEAEAMYNQFKKFNQFRNFHPLALLQQEVRRVVSFGKTFIIPQRVPAQCSVAGWKLLHKLKLYPADEEYYAFLTAIDDVQQV